MDCDKRPTIRVFGTLTFFALHSDASYGDTHLAWDLVAMVYDTLSDADLPEDEILRFCWVPYSVENLSDPAPDAADDPYGYYQDGRDYSNHAAFKGEFCADIVKARRVDDVRALLLDWLSSISCLGVVDPRDLEVSSYTLLDVTPTCLLGDRVAALLARPEVSEVARLAVENYVRAIQVDW